MCRNPPELNETKWTDMSPKDIPCIDQIELSLTHPHTRSETVIDTLWNGNDTDVETCFSVSKLR